MKATHARPLSDRFHEWRKRAKCHRYQLRLLQDAWPGPLAAWRAEARELLDRLGEDHDLAGLRDTLLAATEEFGDASTIRLLIAQIHQRQMELRQACRPLYARL
jgi:CHAD domain-containing protein